VKHEWVYLRPAANGIEQKRSLAEFFDWYNLRRRPYVRIAIDGDDLAACRDKISPQLALYIGGMGVRSKNYYNHLAKRLGYEAAAAEIQDHFPPAGPRRPRPRCPIGSQRGRPR
jgi:hypothetical protein